MNRVSIVSLATVCGALAQPTAMAETFIHTPAPVICPSGSDVVSHEKLAEFITQVNFGKELLKEITENADSLYFSFIEMDADEARKALNKADVNRFQASEMLMRGFEIEINALLEMEGMPEFIISEMKSYVRLIAKARSVTTRFNGYVKQLTQQPKTFESEINFDALKELASDTTEKLSTKQFH